MGSKQVSLENDPDKLSADWTFTVYFVHGKIESSIQVTKIKQ